MAKVVSLLPEFLDQSGDPDPEPEPNGNGGPTTFNAVIVSGAGSEFANGLYTFSGIYEGKPFYNREDADSIDETFLAIRWTGSFWQIKPDDVEYISPEDVPYPWLVASWDVVGAPEPAPTLTPTNV
jgi:hypothetical protein